jgi:dihydropyrimidine dehydrogenase (NAD+) subunit PreA
MIARAFEAGWGGAVVKTLVDESVPVVNVSPRLNTLTFESSPDEPRKIYGMHNIELATDRKLSVHLEEIRQLRKDYPDRIIVASLMAEADNKDQWQTLARRCEEAGTQALELNFSCPHKGMPGKTVGSAIGHDPDVSASITRWVKEAVKIPVWTKLTPNITDIAEPGMAVKQAGADAISAINTVLCLSGINIDTFEPYPTVNGYGTFGGYSGPAVKPIALRIVAELGLKVGLPVSGVGGISTWSDAAEFLLAGASTVQIGSAAMFEGYEIIKDLTDGLAMWMEDKGFSRVADCVGLALPKFRTIDQLDRSYHLVSAVDAGLCVKCDRCYVSCRDGGHQAITLGEDRVPVIDEEKCTGCSLCLQVCPVWDCVTMKHVQKVGK